MSTVDSQIQLYQVDNQVSLEVNVEQDTVWLSQAQMSDLFGRDVSVISRHINNAIGDEEVMVLPRPSPGVRSLPRGDEGQRA